MAVTGDSTQGSNLSKYMVVKGQDSEPVIGECVSTIITLIIFMLFHKAYDMIRLKIMSPHQVVAVFGSVKGIL